MLTEVKNSMDEETKMSESHVEGVALTLGQKEKP